MRIRRVVVLGWIPLLAALGGCGSSSGGGTGGSVQPNGEASKPAEQILNDAAAALRSVHSLRMQGTVDIEKRPTAVTLALQPPAMSVSMQQGTAAAAFDVVSGTAYIKANSAFYEHQAKVPTGVVSLIANRWFKAPTEGGVSALTKGLDLKTLSRCLVENHGTLHVGETTTVNGQPAVVVVDKGDLPGSTPNKLYVATTGAPLPLRALATGKQRPGGVHDAECNESGGAPTQAGEVLTFSDYNQPMGIAAPAGAVDFSQFAH